MLTTETFLASYTMVSALMGDFGWTSLVVKLDVCEHKRQMIKKIVKEARVQLICENNRNNFTATVEGDGVAFVLGVGDLQDPSPPSITNGIGSSFATVVIVNRGEKDFTADPTLLRPDYNLYFLHTEDMELRESIFIKHAKVAFSIKTKQHATESFCMY